MKTKKEFEKEILSYFENVASIHKIYYEWYDKDEIDENDNRKIAYVYDDWDSELSHTYFVEEEKENTKTHEELLEDLLEIVKYHKKTKAKNDTYFIE